MDSLKCLKRRQTFNFQALNPIRIRGENSPHIPMKKLYVFTSAMRTCISGRARFAPSIWTIALALACQLHSQDASAVACSAGNASVVNSAYLALYKVYAFPVGVAGRNWKITAAKLRVTSGNTILKSYSVGVVKMTTQPLAVTSILGQKACSVNTNIGSATVTCTFDSPIYVNLYNSKTETIGIQVTTDTAGFIRYSVATYADVVSSNPGSYVATMVATPDLANTAAADQLYPEITIDYEPVFLNVPTNAAPQLRHTNTTNNVAFAAGATKGTIEATACHATTSNTDSLTFDPSKKALSRIGSNLSAPASLFNAANGNATKHDHRRAIWKNPRGLKYYYAIIQDGTNGLVLYKSATGSSWSSVATLTADLNHYADVFTYEDAGNSQLIAYAVYSYKDPSATENIYYQRMLIADNASDPACNGTTCSTSTKQDTGKNGGRATISRDRNGYAHIFQVGDGNANAGTIVSLFASTTNTPGDTPTWTANTTVLNSGNTANDWTTQFVPFSSGSHILGLTYLGRPGSPQNLMARNVTSFDGSSYTLASAAVTLNADVGGTAYRPVSTVVDSSGYGHMLIKNGVDDRLDYYKSSNANDFLTWSTVKSLEVTAPTSVAISIDRSRSPNRLYAFYHMGTEAQTYYKYIDVNSATNLWSSANVLVDSLGAHVDFLNVGRELVNGTIPFMYTKQTSTYSVRFVDFTPP